MSEEVTNGGLSRRSMIKRLGAGAAVAWTAPALLSVNSSASASPACAGDDWLCGDPFTECGTGPDGQICICDTTVEGATFCWQDTSCGSSPACNSSADCPPGWACVTSCCGTSCLPACGTVQAAGSLDANGPTALGR